MKPWKDPYELNRIIPVNIKDGVSGPWKVESFEVSKEAEKMQLMRSTFSSGRGRYVPAGKYKAIKRNGQIIMSNTPDEIRDCYGFFREAKGRVLINGLGLGVVLTAILAKIDDKDNPAVKEVTVVELSQDVINLVGPTFKKDPRVTIVNHDAFTYKAEGKFDAVWHDIWDDITSDNLETMKKLHRRYGKKTSWQGSWCRERCEYYKRFNNGY